MKLRHIQYIHYIFKQTNINASTTKSNTINVNEDSEAGQEQLESRVRAPLERIWDLERGRSMLLLSYDIIS